MSEESKSLYIWLAQFIGFLGLLAFCLWLALRPKGPRYSITFISIQQPSNQNGTIFYSIDIENQNQDSSIYYDNTALSFIYGKHQDKVGETTIRSFHQGTGKNNVQSGKVNAKPGALKRLLSNATTELNVALMTRFRYKTWGIKSKFHGLNLVGVLPIGADGKLSGKEKKYKLKKCSKKILRSAKH